MNLHAEIPKNVAPGECIKVIREKGHWYAQIVELVSGRIIREVDTDSPMRSLEMLLNPELWPERRFQLLCDGEPVITGTMARIQEHLAVEEDFSIGAALSKGYDITARKGD